jgi:hypothetical protein
MMEKNLEIGDEEWDSKYFNLIYALLELNSKHYEERAMKLLEVKTLNVEIRGVPVQFKLTPMGCAFDIRSNSHHIGGASWERMGWRKSKKQIALPEFFAQAEATILMQINE